MLDKIIRLSQYLNQNELRTLYNHIGTLLGPAVVYQQKPAKCGCKKCKEGGEGHGLYWYGYFTYEGKTRCIYIGREFREIDPLVELDNKQSKANKRR